MSKLDYNKRARQNYAFYGPEVNSNSIKAREVSVPATESQKKFMTQLQIKFDENITKKEARWLIQDCLDKKNGINRTKRHYQNSYLTTLKAEKKKFEKERRIQEYRGIKKQDQRAKPLLGKLRKIDKKIHLIHKEIKEQKSKQVVHRVTGQGVGSLPQLEERS